LGIIEHRDVYQDKNSAFKLLEVTYDIEHEFGTLEKTECLSPYYFESPNVFKVQICQLACKSGYYLENGVGISVTKTTGQSQFIFDNNLLNQKCSKCSNTCLTCSEYPF